MRASCLRREKPTFWFITGGSITALGLSMVIVAIIVKTAVYSSLTKNIYLMRFLDSTEDPDDCETMILGDASCSGKRYVAWSMPSKTKYETCMTPEAPASKSVSAASKWCALGDRECDKPTTCQPGEKLDYHFFSVQNPVDVLKGEKAELVELESIKITKSTDRVDVSHSKLKSDGILEWKEAYRHSLTNPKDEGPLDQIVVMPNPALFTTISTGDHRVSTDAIVHFLAAAQFYTGFQKVVTNLTSSTPVRSWFTGASHINFDTLVKDQFREGKFTLALGEILASPACPLLVPILSTGLKSAIPPAVAIPIMCHSGYRNNIGLSAFGLLLKGSKLHITPRDSPFFYEHEKGCPAQSERPSNACYITSLCPHPVNSTEYKNCAKPSLSQDDVDHLFKAFDEIDKAIKDKDPQMASAIALGFLTGCRAEGHDIEPEDLCDKLIAQLLRVGRSALTINNPKWESVKTAYGWNDNPLDAEIAAKVIPYFVKGTVRSLMGFGADKPTKDPLGLGHLGPQLWVDSLHEDGSVSKFTKGPFTQQVSSAHGVKGLNYFVAVNGMNRTCAFDYGCISNPDFRGLNCEWVENVCEPDRVGGYASGFVPGRIFGDWEFGTEDFHKVGAKKTMFMPEFFIAGDFTQTETDADWKEGLKVDKWKLSNMNVKRDRCDRTDARRGMDCDSPRGTKNLGYQLSYAAKMNPKAMHIPVFASFPWFKDIVPVTDPGAYDPVEKLEMTACKGCGPDRDFGTEMYTEPETGAHVYGSQKLQMNVRLSAKPAAKSRIPGTEGRNVDTGSLFMDTDLDVLIPTFWVNRYDAATASQAAKLASIQSLPTTIDIVFGTLLGFGLLFMMSAVLLIRKGLSIKRQERELLCIRRRDMGQKHIEPAAGYDTERASTVEDAESGEEGSKSTSGPEVLSAA